MTRHVILCYSIVKLREQTRREHKMTKYENKPSGIYTQANFFSCTDEGAERFHVMRNTDWNAVSDFIEGMGYDVEDTREWGNANGESFINVYFDCGD